jgi:hypothetical protein
MSPSPYTFLTCKLPRLEPSFWDRSKVAINKGLFTN